MILLAPAGLARVGSAAAAQADGWIAYGGEWVPLDGAVSSVTWTETDDGVRAALPSDVLFDFDSAVLRPEASSTLDRLADGIRERTPARVRVEGHTDAKGSDAYNLDLSNRRAGAVLDYLSDSGEIEGGMMRAEGFGEARPVAPNAKPDGSDDPEGRQRNRRVEIVLENG